MIEPLAEHYAVRFAMGWVDWRTFDPEITDKPQVVWEFDEASSRAKCLAARFTALGLHDLAESVEIVKRSVTTTYGSWEKWSIPAHVE